ncbi:mucosal pentraxin-like [Loxodonta africana]|uniref:Pentraxin family member n=1 Tax=Loxodonta africana TaxID=9785 RepID=G3TWL3_LOXAF|nr:mucosal pentraxin-like [Loxodonta africana]XP_049731664.1 mucosal pentraxin-like [Elephas maximus indicus]
MEKLLLGVLFPTILSGAVTHSDLRGKAFIFPQESDTAYVSLIPRVKRPLQNFTLCLKAFTDLTRPYSLFSYSTQSQANELLLFVNKMGEYILYIGNVGATFKAPESPYAPIRVCATWESASGIAELWVNGKPLGRKGLKKGYSVGAEAKIILGQEQDSFGGKFDAKQSLVGEIWDVSLWDRVLSLKEVGASRYNGNVLNWQALHYEASGYVVIKPKVWV